MSKLEITEDMIKNILRNKDSLINTIHKKMHMLNTDIYRKNDILVSVSLQSKRISDMPKSFGDYKDIHDVYERYEKKVEEQKYEFQIQFWNLAEAEEMIERVWLCFMALGEPYFSVLETMYVKNEKYMSTQENSGMSNQTFNKKRKKGIEMIIKLYNSDISEVQLENMISTKEFTPSVATKSKDVDINQMTLFEDDNT